MKVEIKTEEVRCDRCSRKVSKSGGPVSLTAGGVMPAALIEDRNPAQVVDLCRQCLLSLQGWVSRGGGQSADDD
jgi:hypothetical protein